MGAKYRLTTLGCKVNQYETQVIRELLESTGMRAARPGEAADWAVVNTCAVTGAALRKSRQAVRRAARDKAARVIVIGCGAAADTQRLRAIEGVEAVFGHNDDIRRQVRRLVTDQLESAAEETTSGPITPARHEVRHQVMPTSRAADRDEVSIRPMAPPSQRPSQGCSHPQDKISIAPSVPIVKHGDALVARISHFEGHQRAFLKVQDGCDASCTYCIIPRLRHHLRWKRVEAAVAEARTLIRSGHKEIILTGIFLGAYGRSTAIRRRFEPVPCPREPLAALVDALARIEGLQRLRLSSLEPGDVDQALLEVLARHDNCVPHLHLPLQSGSAEILRRMNRQYTVDAFIDMINRVRSALDRPAISTDIMVGFPGETETDFQATLEIARYARFCKIHAFPFSPRDKTAAARWREDFVSQNVVKERMRRLAHLEMELSLEFRRRFIGTVERVIVEADTEPGQSVGPVSNRTMAHQSVGPVSNRSIARQFVGPVSNQSVESPCHTCHGRADRYFEIHFEAQVEGRNAAPGDVVHVRIDRVTADRTHGTRLLPDGAVAPHDDRAEPQALACAMSPQPVHLLEPEESRCPKTAARLRCGIAPTGAGCGVPTDMGGII